VIEFGPLDLWRLAGKRSFDRGERYVDAVEDVRDVLGGVRATVRGTETYRVRLDWSRGRLAGECDCPWGGEGEFCKHCVAVGLVVVARDHGGTGDDLRHRLAALDHATLVDLLCECAAQDPDLARRLAQRAADLSPATRPARSPMPR
jgi:uncharacterized Zn finger protein